MSRIVDSSSFRSLLMPSRAAVRAMRPYHRIPAKREARSATVRGLRGAASLTVLPRLPPQEVVCRALQQAVLSQARAGALAVIVAVGAAACGSSSSSTSAGAPWTVARARAFAAAVILTLTDVPGFTAGPHENTAADRQNVAQLARCAGAVDPSRRIVDVHSDDFSRGSGLQVQTVGSSVDVLPSASLAQQDFMKFTAASARQCVGTYVARALAQSASSSSIRFGTASILTLALPPGTDRNSFGYRFVIPLSATGVKIKVYTDLLFHRAGPAEVAFDDVGIGTPFPTRDQQRLFALLVARADAHAK
jgi:hypothetical protein